MGAQDLISSITSGVSQVDRLLKLDTPAGQDVLLPLRVAGKSRLGRNFDYTVDIASLNGTLELKSLIAKPVTLWVQQADKSYLPFNGLVYAARKLGADGALSYYQLKFSSWLHFLKFRKDARIFQDQTPDEILAEVFSAHPQAQGAFRFAVLNPAPARSYCTQYEDDWNFVNRIMESEGWFGYFEQSANGNAHTLVITDDLYSVPPSSPQSIDFSRANVSGESNAFTQWAGTRTLQSTQYSPTTFDYKSPGATKSSSIPTVDNQGDLPEQAEVYEYTGPYTYLDSNRGDRLAKIRLEEWESRAKRFFGSGAVRQAQVGYWFQLKQHPEHDQDTSQNREFAILAVDTYIENNVPMGNTKPFPYSLQTQLAEIHKLNQGEAPASLTQDLSSGSDGFYLVEVEAQRRTVPFRSPFEHRKPVMHTQTAIVVGPGNAEVYTDSLNRVKVKMHWDRLGAGDQNSSCWMRVMYPFAGGDYGGVFTPRVGHEVAITYLDGDCDRPVISGCLFNGSQKPQWHSNGLISGFKSKEYQGSGANQLVFDDSTGQNRTQLLSSVANSYLHLGYLVDHTGNVRGNYLGTGFDLKSEAFGAVRASQGLYLSTFTRGGTSTAPLDAKEASQHLSDSAGIMETQSDAASAVQAEPLTGGHDELLTFANATNQTASGKSGGGSTAGGGTGEAASFSEPVMVLASPNGIGLTSMKSTHVVATDHVNLVSGGNTYVAATQSYVASVGQKVSFFAQNGGMKFFAGKGKVQMTALSDNLELTADKTLKVVSTSDAVVVSAQKEITLSAGGAVLRIANGDVQVHAPGKLDFKGSSHDFDGPQSQNSSASVPASGSCASQFASAAASGAALV
jgi:type VI secretion system secreted protein VgrG